MMQAQGELTEEGNKTAGSRASPATMPASGPREVGRKARLRRWLIVLALLAAVIAVDQVAKWWAWRHVPDATVNPGGDFLTGPTIGAWYANPIAGALLDLVDFGLVSVAVAVLAQRRRRAAIIVCSSLMIGGWASNLVDRLGMHYWTAPGSIRGAVDFISFGGHYWNLADFFIIGATPLLLLATTYQAHRAVSQPATCPAAPATSASRRARVPVVAAAGAALITAVALGATHHGTLARPQHATIQTGQHAPNPRPGRAGRG